MITSFEVGTVFKIVDRATPTVRSLIADMTRLEAVSGKAKRNFAALGSMKLGNLSRAVTGLTDQAIKMQGAYDSALTAITAGADASIRQTQLLAGEWRNVAIAARAAGAASVSAARAQSGAALAGPWGPRGGGRSIFSAHTSYRRELPGGTHLGMRGGGMANNAALAAAGILGYGVDEDAKLTATVARMMMSAGQPLGPGMMKTPMGAAIRKAIQQGMVETGLSAKELEASASKLVLQMGGIPFNKRVDILPDVFRFAGIESQLKGVDAGEATQALVGLLHMTGAYKPNDIQKLASKFAFASTISPVGLPGIERAASYVLPLNTTALGLDPASLLLVMAQAQSAGILSGKSGTWFQGMFQALSPKAGFASLLTGHGAKGRRQGLTELGLVDKEGAPTGLRMLEQNDWAGFIGTVKSHLDAVPQEQRMGIVSQAMGSAQAARGLMTLMLPSMIQLLPELQREQKLFAQDPKATLDSIADASPLLKFQRTWAELSNVMMDIGSAVMPVLIVALRELDGALKTITGPISYISSLVPAGRQNKGSVGFGLFGRTFGALRSAETLFGGKADGSGAIIVPPKYGTAPTAPVAGDGLLHKSSFIGDTFKRADTWSDIGQGVTVGGNSYRLLGGGGAPSFGGVPIIKASLGPSGSGGMSTLGQSAMGGGGINNAAAFDATFKGTPLAGHWSDVVAAAQANGIQPNLMAAIMAHETGRGKNVSGNNVAGLMDPATGMSRKKQFDSIASGIAAAGSTIGKNWKRAGGSLHKMAGIYAPIGAANDPRGLNGGWEAGVGKFLGNGASTAGAIAVPPGVLSGAAALLQGGASNGQLQSFMAANGYPRSGNWCGEFAAAVEKSVGGTPPKGAAIASNWLNWGKHVDPGDVKPGDIAVRRRSRFGGMVIPGATGGHVGIVSGVGKGSFDLLGGNQGRAIVPHANDGEYEFRRGGDPATAIIPPPTQQLHTSPVNLHIDGRMVAQSTMKHIVKAGNGPARGPRLADYTSVRPISA